MSEQEHAHAMTFKEEVFTDLMDLLDKRIEKQESLLKLTDREMVTREKMLIELLQLKAYVYRRFADYNQGLTKGIEVNTPNQ